MLIYEVGACDLSLQQEVVGSFDFQSLKKMDILLLGLFDVYGEGSDLGSLVTLYIHLFPSGSQINVASLFSIITLFSRLEGAPAPAAVGWPDCPQMTALTWWQMCNPGIRAIE